MSRSLAIFSSDSDEYGDSDSDSNLRDRIGIFTNHCSDEDEDEDGDSDSNLRDRIGIFTNHCSDEDGDSDSNLRDRIGFFTNHCSDEYSIEGDDSSDEDSSVSGLDLDEESVIIENTEAEINLTDSIFSVPIHEDGGTEINASIPICMEEFTFLPGCVEDSRHPCGGCASTYKTNKDLAQRATSLDFSKVSSEYILFVL
jgi:hypothetical protein